MGTLGAGFGNIKSVKTAFKGVQGVLLTGVIAAGGAIATDSAYDKIGEKLNLSGWQRDAAKMGFGLVLAIVLAKMTKKPKLAAAFGIGPVMAGAMRIYADVLQRPSGMSGLVTVRPYNQYGIAGAPPLGSVVQVGGKTPRQVMFPGAQPVSSYGRNAAVAGI